MAILTSPRMVDTSNSPSSSVLSSGISSDPSKNDPMRPSMNRRTCGWSRVRSSPTRLPDTSTALGMASTRMAPNAPVSLAVTLMTRWR